MNKLFGENVATDNKFEECTLEEYKQQVHKLFDNLSNYLYKNDEFPNTIFHIEIIYIPNLNDKDGYDLPCYSRLFKSIPKMKDFVMLIEDHLSEHIEYDNEDEPLGNYYCWKIDAYEYNESKDFQTMYTIWTGPFMDIFNVSFEPSYHPKNMNELKIFKQWDKLHNQYPLGDVRIMFAYKVGDIIEVDRRPFENVEYYIYSDKDNNQVVFYDKGKLKLKTLFNRYDYEFEPLCYRIVDECPVAELKKAQEILKNATEEAKKLFLKTVEEG